MASLMPAAETRWMRARLARSAVRAAFAPHAPCTPPPGWADDEARYSPAMGVSGPHPDEIAPSYVFFASGRLSSYYSGEVLAPIGGETLPG